MSKYKTVIIDFPWDLNLRGLSFRPSHKIIPYKTMTDEECKQFPINDFAADECCLFLWVTQTTLPKGLQLIEMWGFKYHCLFTWDKTNGLTICGITRRTEFVIYAYRGRLQLKTKGKSLMTIFKEAPNKHSEKPAIFYSMLLKNTPEPRIDIFARKRHYGFDAWGDQAENPTTLEVYTN